jgi:hypothetical protein
MTAFGLKLGGVMTIVRHARVLAAALMIGAAVLGVSTGQAEARDNLPGDNGVRCVYYDPQTGDMDFYFPGDSIFLSGSDGNMRMLYCMEDGTWKDVTDDVGPTKGTSGRR